MGLLQRRTPLGQALKDAGDGRIPDALASALSDVRIKPPKVVAPALAAAAALTAGSAVLSALRRRREQPESDR
jgi:hypothetical protein